MSVTAIKARLVERRRQAGGRALPGDSQGRNQTTFDLSIEQKFGNENGTRREGKERKSKCCLRDCQRSVEKHEKAKRTRVSTL